MKKYIVAISSMLIIANNTCSAMNTQQVKKEYELALTGAFFKTGDMNQVKKTFYDYAIDSNALNLCYKAAANIKFFVDGHSKNLMGVKDSLLNKSAALLEKLTLDTISTIKITRGLISSNADCTSQINIFDQIERECFNIRTTLNKEFFTIADKKESRDVLIFCFDFLSLLAKTAREAANMKK